MKIVKVETYPLLYRLTEPYGDANGFKKYRSCFLIKVVTESGIEGWGECIDWLPTLQYGFQQRIIPFLVGKDCTNRTQLVDVIKKWHERSAAAVSMALTDIIAKYANLHICELWGGHWREQIPVYASFQSYIQNRNWIENSLKKVESAMTQNYTKIKVKIGGKPVQEDRKHLESIFQLVDQHQMDIAIDGNESYDLATTKEWIDWLQPRNNILWLEEPMPLKQINDYQKLSGTSPIPIAGGENLKSAIDFLPYLQGGVDIIQPDTMHMGGIEEFKLAGTLARTCGLRVSPHAYDGVLSRLYAAYVLACLPPWSKMKQQDIEPIEWDFMENPFTHLASIKPSNGEISIPTGPGLGVELDLELIEKYRWDGETYI